jgi:TP901 family phage tail tape measure protein
MDSISSSMRRTSAAANAAAARARAAALRAQAVQAKSTGATKDQVEALRSSARAWDAHANKIQANAKRLENIKQALSGVGKVAELTGITMVAAGGFMALGLGKAVQTASDWDKQVRLTFTQVDKKYKPTLKELGDIGLRVSKDIAVPFNTVQDALFDVFSSTEANLPQAEALLRSFAKAAVAGNTDIQTASRATIGIMNAYQLPFKDVNKVLDIQFKLVREGVGTYEEWAQRIGLVTPSAVRAGQSLETMAAALSTSTRLGTSAARAGTAVARAFDAMSNPKTEKALAQINVKTRDAKGNFRPLVDVLGDWRKALEKMPKADRIKNIIETLKGAGSTIEARRFLQNMLLTKGGLELFQDQIKTFATDKGAFQDAYAEMSKSISSKTTLLKNSWKTLELAIGQALLPIFSKLVDGLQRVTTWFNKLTPGQKHMIAMVLLLVSGLTILAGIVLVIVGGIAALIGTIATAGAAFLPLAAAIAGVAAIVAIITTTIVLFAAGMYIAYQKSLPLRNLMYEVSQTVKDAWTNIKEFASGLWQAFSSRVLPPLQQLWGVIQTKVMPAVAGLVRWFRTELMPVARKTGEYIITNLIPAFNQAATFIRSYLIPAISQAVDWWNRNKDAILPIIKFLAQTIAVGLVVSAWLAGKLVQGLIIAAQFSIAFGKVLIQSVIVPIKLVWAAIQTVIGWLKSLYNWFKKVGEGAANGFKSAKQAVTTGINAIKNMFSGASGWLLSAGANIVRGLTNGIRGNIGMIRAAGAAAAQAAISAAKATLKVQSPSKVFKDIGANVVRGFVLGVQGNRKKLQDTFFALARDIKRSINAADIKSSAKKSMLNRWTKTLNKNELALLKLESKRSSLQTKLAAATQSYNDQLKIRNDLATAITNALAASADLTSLDDTQKTSAKSMAEAMKIRLDALKTFQANLTSLAKRGFDKQTIADLASQGVDQAGQITAALAAGSQNDLNQLSTIQQQIRAMAGNTGNVVADSLYKAGIDAAAGLMKGLNSQIAAITKQMTAIANALVKAIKKELGIKSPSKVMAALGVNTAQGYANGYLNHMNKQQRSMVRASMFTPGAPGYRTRATATPWGGDQKTIHNQFNIKTQEIDPRKHSAELGWELQGRM